MTLQVTQNSLSQLVAGSTVRRTNVSLSIAGTDVTQQLAPELISFEHSDDTERNADTITIKISDAQHKYLLEWTIDKGTEIVAKIQTFNWSKPGETLEVECGSFYVDRIEYSSNPSIVTIKATSLPVSGSFKGVVKNKGWENQTLKQIAEQIAKESGLKLDYRAKDNPQMARCDQDYESDGRLLLRLATQAGLCVKVQKKTLIIFDEEELDKQEPWTTLTRDITPIKSWRLTTSSNHTVRGIRSSYMSPDTGKVTKYDFTPRDPPEAVTSIDLDKVRPLDPPKLELWMTDNNFEPQDLPPGWDKYTWNFKDSEEPAKKRARKHCRRRNRAEWEIDITLPGSVMWAAGTVVKLDETWGPKFGDSNYLIRRVVHKVDRSSGYECNLSLRKVLKDY